MSVHNNSLYHKDVRGLIYQELDTPSLLKLSAVNSKLRTFVLEFLRISFCNNFVALMGNRKKIIAEMTKLENDATEIRQKYLLHLSRNTGIPGILERITRNALAVLMPQDQEKIKSDFESYERRKQELNKQLLQIDGAFGKTFHEGDAPVFTVFGTLENFKKLREVKIIPFDPSAISYPVTHLIGEDILRILSDKPTLENCLLTALNKFCIKTTDGKSNSFIKPSIMSGWQLETK